MAILTIEQMREAHKIKAALNEAVLFLDDAQRMKVTPVTQNLVSMYQAKRDKLQRQYQELLPSVDETLEQIDRMRPYTICRLYFREGFSYYQIAKILDGEQNTIRQSANWAIDRVNRLAKKESEE